MPEKTTESSKIRHERFAREFVLDRNARRAYQTVYGVENVKAADAAASRLMKVKRVREMVAALELASHARLEITKDKLERHLAEVTFVDLRDFYNDDGTLKPPRMWTKEMAAAVRSVDSEEIFSGTGKDREWIGYAKRITLKDSVSTAALLGAPHGIGVKKVEIGRPGDFNANEKIEEVKKRVMEKGARLGLVVKFPGAKKA